MAALFAAGVAAVSACGGSTINEQPGPRGLRADQHLAIAHREDDRAEEVVHWPETQAGLGVAELDQRVAGVWFGHWDTAGAHRRLADEHRTAAAALEAEYEEACGDTPLAEVSVSPLQRYATGGMDAPGGVVLVLSPDAGPPDHLLATMRCHRAWMMLGRTDMDDCPLDLPGLQVDARGDATSISLHADGRRPHAGAGAAPPRGPRPRDRRTEQASAVTR